MMALLNIGIITEMLFINLYTSYICSKKKKQPLDTWLYLIFFTIGFNVLNIIIINLLGPTISFNGSFLYFLTGFLYIIPLQLLYAQPWRYTIIVMCTSWIYSMVIYSLALRVGLFFPLGWSIPVVFISQTILYLLTFLSLQKFFKDKFNYILQNIENRTMNLLLLVSISWFVLLFLKNYSYFENNSWLMEILVFLVISVNVILSYKLFYSFVYYNKSAEKLSLKTKIDPLTNLKNRESLYEDALHRIQNKQPFTIVFIDLDDFKTVNDTYGHSSGDKYLIEFANAVKGIPNPDDSFYRLSGDEFVLLCAEQEAEIICSSLLSLEFINRFSIPFQGLSLGCASYPKDGNDLSQLLYLADLNMYQEKKEKHRKYIS